MPEIAKTMSESEAALRRENTKLKAKVKRLQAIVDNLPKTADGKYVEKGKPYYFRQQELDDTWGIISCTQVVPNLSCLYSTRKAAEVAGGE